ncbi:MAG: alanine racemase, partial [Ktedonobacterales bacterium]|nr:alanine racemase [Ktedonobacterales bacterium]
MIVLDDVIAATQAEPLIAGARSAFEGFAHDSRIVTPDDCFVAVRGVHGDGHDFLLDAVERGARAILAERARLDTLLAEQPDLLNRLRSSGAALLVVPDTREALRRYAAYILRAWHPTVIAVAGSTGKTTTKEAIAEVLSLRWPTFRSWRNFNDLLGLPLSLGRLEPTHQFVVVEMGADHPGEIAELCAVARPTIGVITNVSPTHLLYFGSLAALADELGQLPASLPPDGLAVLNADDPTTGAMLARTAARPLLFAPRAPTDPAETRILARYAALPLGEEGRTALTLSPFEEGLSSAPVTFPHLHGDHWAYAVLAALTIGEVLGVAQGEALEALRELEPLPGRMRWLAGADGAALLDDSHNATPASAAAGLASLSAIAAAQRAPRIAILGDMLRLGNLEHEAHRALGGAAAARADYLVTQGVRAETLAEEAMRAGLSAERIAITHTAEDAATAARTFAAQARAVSGAHAIIYIKGSEEMRMEQVTARLLAHPEQAEECLDRQAQAWQRVVVMRPDRPTWLEIDLSAIGQNTRLLKEVVGPDVRVLASLKADAYGHGALRVARTVLRNGATWLGVATVSEAQPLREAGITAPILIFGYTAPWQARDAVRLDLRATVYGLESARALARAACDLGREMRVHIKIDTGMARLGLR